MIVMKNMTESQSYFGEGSCDAEHTTPVRKQDRPSTVEDLCSVITDIYSESKKASRRSQKEISMRHTPSEAISTSRRHGSRMSRLLAIMISCCLALSLSMVLPAVTHQAPQAHAATCTATHTMTFTAAAGNVTAYSDNSLLPGPDPSQSQAVVPVQLDASNNVCSFSLNAPFKVKDPNGNTAEVKSLNPSTVTSPGTWNPTTGVLTFDGTVTLDMLPLLQGSFTTADGTLSTENSVTTNGGVHLTGVRCNAQHQCTLTGATSFNAGGFVGTVHVWLTATGTFQ